MNRQANLDGEQWQKRDQSLNNSVLATFQAASGKRVVIANTTFLSILAFYQQPF